MEDYQKEMEKLFDQMLSLKKNILKKFKNYYPFDTNILNSDNVEEKKQIDYLLESLDSPDSLKLLYRGSENNFSASQFHVKCDNIPNTVTLVRNEFRKTIAGFSKYEWDGSQNRVVSDAGKNAFLLSLDCKEKLLPKDDQNLIYNHPNYGPTFGGGSQSVKNGAFSLKISDSCKLFPNSSATSSAQYRRPTPTFPGIQHHSILVGNLYQ